MLDLKTVELSDKKWIDPIIAAENSRSADFSFGNIYTWDKMFRQQIAKIGDRYITMPGYTGKLFFAYPIGSGDIKPVIKELELYADEKGFPLMLCGVTAEHKLLLESLYPLRFAFSEDRMCFDYIYRSEKLATLSGKKLQSKRNHVNRFVAENDWTYEPLTEQLAAECIQMLSDWTGQKVGELQPGLDGEHTAIERALNDYCELGLEGGVLRVDEKIVAFSGGECITSDTFSVHFEKAFSSVQGAYQMINREFARQILQRHPNILYINREDDMGKENLRKAKMSYYPEFLIEKYTAIRI